MHGNGVLGRFLSFRHVAEVIFLKDGVEGPSGINYRAHGDRLASLSSVRQCAMNVPATGLGGTPRRTAGAEISVTYRVL